MSLKKSGPKHPQSMVATQASSGQTRRVLGGALQSEESRLSSHISVKNSTQLEDLARL